MALPRAFRREGRPLILAHRGASAERPENTAVAFELALEQGADGVELDVWRCGTGEVVVTHDSNLMRLSGQPVEVRKAPWSVLAALDVGSWFHPRYGDARLMLLPEALDCLGPAAVVDVELKGEGWGDPDLPAAVAAILGRQRRPERFLVSSFNPLSLWRFQRLAPGIASGLLFDQGQALPLRRAMAAPLLRPTLVNPAEALCTPDALQTWHRRGYSVLPWTVDDVARATALYRDGAIGVITNRPAALRAGWP
jgi:glycerophosphoryl diester phosphodiesterase